MNLQQVQNLDPQIRHSQTEAGLVIEDSHSEGRPASARRFNTRRKVAERVALTQMSGFRVPRYLISFRNLHHSECPVVSSLTQNASGYFLGSNLTP